MKKMLGLLLALSMLFSALPLTVYATDNITVTEIMFDSLSVFDGESEPYTYIKESDYYSNVTYNTTGFGESSYRKGYILYVLEPASGVDFDTENMIITDGLNSYKPDVCKIISAQGYSNSDLKTEFGWDYTNFDDGDLLIGWKEYKGFSIIQVTSEFTELAFADSQKLTAADVPEMLKRKGFTGEEGDWFVYSESDSAYSYAIKGEEEWVNQTNTATEEELATAVTTNCVYTSGMVIAPHTHCICGKTGCSGEGHNDEQIWQPWTDPSNLPEESGYYYLTCDVFVPDSPQGSNTSLLTDGEDLVICLNGFKAMSGKQKAFEISGSGHLTLTDCVEDTVTYFKPDYDDDNANILENYYPCSVPTEYCVKGGYLRGCDNTPIVLKGESSCFEMYEGSIVACFSVAIQIENGTVSLHGGSIRLNPASYGAIYNKGGQIFLDGAPVITDNFNQLTCKSCNLDVRTPAVITAKGLSAGANIGLSDYDISDLPHNAVTAEDKKDYSAYFTSDNYTKMIRTSTDNTLQLLSRITSQPKASNNYTVTLDTSDLTNPEVSYCWMGDTEIDLLEFLEANSSKAAVCKYETKDYSEFESQEYGIVKGSLGTAIMPKKDDSKYVVSVAFMGTTIMPVGTVITFDSPSEVTLDCDFEGEGITTLECEDGPNEIMPYHYILTIGNEYQGLMTGFTLETDKNNPMFFAKIACAGPIDCDVSNLTKAAADSMFCRVTVNGDIVDTMTLAEAANVPSTGPDFTGATYSATLSLGENIDIKLTVKNLPAEIDYSKLKVDTTFGGSTKTVNLVSNPKGGYSGVIATAAPTQLGDTAECVVWYDANGNGTKDSGENFKSFSYSVKNYCDYMVEHSANEKLVALCKATLNYGAWAQQYCDYKTDALVYSSLDAADRLAYSANLADGMSVPTVVPFAAANGISGISAAMVMGSQSTLKFYITTDLTLSKSDITVRNNRSEIAAFTLSGPVDGKYELSIPSINANRLSRTYTVSLKGVSFTYGPYNYCSYAIGATEAEFTNTVKTLSRAIYNYGQAAKAYFGD